MTVSDYFKYLTGERYLRGAAQSLAGAINRNPLTIEQAARRGKIPAHWYPDIHLLAERSGKRAPEDSLFRLRRAPPQQEASK